MQKQQFTVYRTTQDFMESLNVNPTNLQLHRQRSLDGSETAIEAIKALLKAEQLVAVAIVNCSTENDDLFRITNSINDYWGNNAEVSLEPNAERAFMSSSSVGDIYKDQSGEYYVYTDVGVKTFKR
jgi:PBP1b-binding outer membrane lipoprotein LpoB